MTGAISEFAVNRRQDGPLPLEVDLCALPESDVIQQRVLEQENLLATNTADPPDEVEPHAGG